MKFDIGSAVGGGLSAIGGFASTILSHKWQTKENQKERAFNAAQAQLNRNFQVEQSNATNAYNSPKQQIERLTEAGLNPALMYDSSTGIVPATSPSGSQASSSASSVGDTSALASGMANLGNVIANSKLMQAQTDNINEDTKTKYIDNLTRDLLNNTNINLAKSNIDLNTSELELKPKQAQILAKTLDTMDTQIEQVNQQIKLMRAQTVAQRLENYFNSDTYDTRIQQLSDIAHITHAQANNIVQSLLLQNALTNAQIGNTETLTKQYEESVKRAQADYADMYGRDGDNTSNLLFSLLGNQLQLSNMYTAEQQKRHETANDAEFQTINAWCGAIGQIFGASLSTTIPQR